MIDIKAVNNDLVNKNKELFSKNGKQFLIPYPCTDKTLCTLISVTLPRGVYLIECWGASGGDRSATVKDGGRGAYTSGILTINTRRTLYLSIGASSGLSKVAAYGGGGLFGSKCTDDPSRAGGGATDVRTKSSEEFEGLKSRIMVAAGGGAGSNHGSAASGGYGGNLTGSSNSPTFNGNSYDPYNQVIPATQTTEGISYIMKAASVTNGTFGKGGSVDTNFCSTGGGGYYGGATGSNANCVVMTGAGGSSFISGHSGCDAVSEDSTEGSIKHTGKSKHFSGLVFTSTQMRSGQQEMPLPELNNDTLTVGRTGDGSVRITIISRPNYCTKVLIHNNRYFSIFVFILLCLY